MNPVIAPEPALRTHPAELANPMLYLAGCEPGVEYWRVERVARFLDISKKRVYQLVQEKRLQAIRLGPRQMRVRRESIDGYVAELISEGE